jgi:hypothetical protein
MDDDVKAASIDSPPAVSEAKSEVEISARDALVIWANRQDSWVRALVEAIVKSSGLIGQATIDQIYDRYLAEKGLSEESIKPVDLLSSGSAATAAKTKLVLERLSEVGGVNALSTDQEITFNGGLTIIFGENGSGKTGYTRILKAIANVRTVEPILGDVNETGVGTPQTCMIGYSEDGVSDVHHWEGETGVLPFTAISIFDSPAVALHVDDDLSYLYTPGDLSLFAVVGAGIDGVHGRLTDAIKDRTSKGNPFIAHFQNGTKVYAKIETLSAATDLTPLADMALDESAASVDLEAGQAKVDALRGGAVDAQISAARARRELVLRLAKIARATQDFQMNLYNDAVKEAVSAESSYADLRAKFATESGADDESQEKWQDFVLAGEEYRSHLEARDAHDPDRCIYCRQQLDEQAGELIATYREFADDAARKRLEAARSGVERLAREILGLDTRAATDAVATAREDHAEDRDLMKAEILLGLLEERLVSVKAGSVVVWDDLDESATEVEEYATKQAANEEALIDTLSSKRVEREEQLTAAQNALAELEDQVELGQRLEAIRGYVENSKWVEKAETLAKRFRGISKSLTTTVKEASETLLNSDFERRFAEECAALRAPKVGLAFPGRRGEPARRKTVSAGHKPSTVLSEGEQKVIALADFLAEASLRHAPAPVIFDDPVNSLDYRRIGEVSARIASLAGERQVIVFTHNIWLAVELLSQFESNKNDCTYYRVTDEGGKGLIVAGSHPRWDTVKATTGKINKTLQDAEACQGEVREALIERAYSLIRTWSEVVIEEEIFAGVLTRFAPNVAMGKLAKVRPERMQVAIDAINPIFEKACRVMEGHSQPLESLGHAPSLEKAQDDWKTLKEARDAYRA